MSDKKFDKLNQIDQDLRRAYPIGMLQGHQVRITKVIGFELFNTRPYHNYETWSDGYEACDGTFHVRAEDLDDCIKQLVELKTELKEAQPWNKCINKCFEPAK